MARKVQGDAASLRDRGGDMGLAGESDGVTLERVRTKAELERRRSQVEQKGWEG